MANDNFTYTGSTSDKFNAGWKAEQDEALKLKIREFQQQLSETIIGIASKQRELKEVWRKDNMWNRNVMNKITAAFERKTISKLQKQYKDQLNINVDSQSTEELITTNVKLESAISKLEKTLSDYKEEYKEIENDKKILERKKRREEAARKLYGKRDIIGGTAAMGIGIPLALVKLLGAAGMLAMTTGSLASMVEGYASGGLSGAIPGALMALVTGVAGGKLGYRGFRRLKNSLNNPFKKKLPSDMKDMEKGIFGIGNRAEGSGGERGGGLWNMARRWMAMPYFTFNHPGLMAGGFLARSLGTLLKVVLSPAMLKTAIIGGGLYMGARGLDSMLGGRLGLSGGGSGSGGMGIGGGGGDISKIIENLSKMKEEDARHAARVLTVFVAGFSKKDFKEVARSLSYAKDLENVPMMFQNLADAIQKISAIEYTAVARDKILKLAEDIVIISNPLKYMGKSVEFGKFFNDTGDNLKTLVDKKIIGGLVAELNVLNSYNWKGVDDQIVKFSEHMVAVSKSLRDMAGNLQNMVWGDKIGTLEKILDKQIIDRFSKALSGLKTFGDEIFKVELKDDMINRWKDYDDRLIKYNFALTKVGESLGSFISSINTMWSKNAVNDLAKIADSDVISKLATGLTSIKTFGETILGTAPDKDYDMNVVNDRWRQYLLGVSAFGYTLSEVGKSIGAAGEKLSPGIIRSIFGAGGPLEPIIQLANSEMLVKLSSAFKSFQNYVPVGDGIKFFVKDFQDFMIAFLPNQRNMNLYDAGAMVEVLVGFDKISKFLAKETEGGTISGIITGMINLSKFVVGKKEDIIRIKDMDEYLDLIFNRADLLIGRVNKFLNGVKFDSGQVENVKNSLQSLLEIFQLSVPEGQTNTIKNWETLLNSMETLMKINSALFAPRGFRAQADAKQNIADLKNKFEAIHAMFDNNLTGFRQYVDEWERLSNSIDRVGDRLSKFTLLKDVTTQALGVIGGTNPQQPIIINQGGSTTSSAVTNVSKTSQVVIGGISPYSPGIPQFTMAHTMYGVFGKL